METIDRYDDQDALLNFKFKGELPEVIKTAAYAPDIASPENRDYALHTPILGGKYPCCDAGNTVASAVYLLECKDVLPADLQKTAAIKIIEHLTDYGVVVPDQLTKLAEQTIVDAFNPSLEELFCRDDDVFEKVDDAFINSTPRGRRQLLMKIKEAGLIDTYSEYADYASDRLGTDIDMAVDARINLLSDPEATVEYTEFKEKVAGLDAEAAITALEDLDTKHSINWYYDSLVIDPVKSILGRDLEKSGHITKTAELDGEYVDYSDIISLASDSKDKLLETFDTEFVNAFTEDPVAVFDSLPITHKRAIKNLI